MAGGLYDPFQQTVQRHPDRIAFKTILEEEARPQETTFKELDNLVKKAAAFFRRKGVQKADKIAIVTSYQIGTIVAVLAALRIGAVLAIIDASLKAGEVRNLLDNAQPKLLVCDSAWSEDLQGFSPQVNTELLASGSFFKLFRFSEEELAYRADIDPDKDIAGYMFTSGTTGNPKAVLLDHANFLASYRGVIDAFRITAGDNILDITRTSHVTGLAAALDTLMRGAIHTYLNDYRKIASGLIKDEKITIWLAVPKAWRGFRDQIYKVINKAWIGRILLRNARLELRQEKAGEDDWLRVDRWIVRAGHRIERQITLARRNTARWILRNIIQRKLIGRQFRFGVSGGGPLEAQIVKDLAAVGIYVLNVYGLTETTAPILGMGVKQLKDVERKAGSVGKLIVGDTRVVLKPLPRERQDQAHPERTLGVLAFAGPSVFKGYNDPQKTAEAFDEDGLFVTGDVAYLDRDGFYFVVGRAKNIIVLETGENVYPEELAEAVTSHGINWFEDFEFFEGRSGGLPVVAVVIKPNLSAIRQFTRTKLPYATSDIQRLAFNAIDEALSGLVPFKRLKNPDHVLVVDGELQKTQSGKVKVYIYQERFNREV